MRANDYKRDIRAVRDIDSVARIGDRDAWIVNEEYVVDRIDQDSWICGCEDYEYRDVDCKHICAVQQRLGLRLQPMEGDEV